MLAIGLLFIGSLKTCFGVAQPLSEVIRARSWVLVPLAWGQVQVLPFHGETSVKVAYRYEFGGRTLSGGRYAFIPPNSFLSAEALFALQDHAPAACYVNPSRPSESVLVRDLPWRAYSWTGLALLLCGALLLLWSRRVPKPR